MEQPSIRYIDTHAHLFAEEFNQDRAEVVERAIAAGVTKLVLPNIDEATVKSTLLMAEAFPGICYSALGLHPTDVRSDWRDQLEIIVGHIPQSHLVAVGEIGIDLYWETKTLDLQLAAFRYQMGLAKELSLPVLIHARNAIDCVLEQLERPEFRSVPAVLHAFNGDAKQLGRAMRLDNVMVGIGGIATYKKGLSAEVINSLDLTRSVLETDAPYLAPVPFRGKRNESAYIPHIAKHLSQVRGETLEHIAELTTCAAEQIIPFHKGHVLDCAQTL